jgi:hypothetical protein
VRCHEILQWVLAASLRLPPAPDFAAAPDPYRGGPPPGFQARSISGHRLHDRGYKLAAERRRRLEKVLKVSLNSIRSSAMPLQRARTNRGFGKLSFA